MSCLKRARTNSLTEKKCPTEEVTADPTTQDIMHMLVQRLDRLQASIDALHQEFSIVADSESEEEANLSKTQY